MRNSLFCLALLTFAVSAAFGETYGDYEVLRSTVLTDTNGAAITDYGGGLAFDGTNLWYTTTKSSSGTLYRIDPETHIVTGRWALPFEAHGIAWDGSRLQIVDSKTEPRVRAYDRQGNLLGSQLVEANSPRFHGLAWDGARLWAADDWFLLQFNTNGTLSRVHSTSWIGIYTALTWDGTNLVAMVDESGWSGAYAPYTLRIDPHTGHVSDYRSVGPNTSTADRHHIAIGGGRMWILKGGGLPARLYEVALPSRAPFPALLPKWGVFPALDGFAVPQRSAFFGGAGLGAFGSTFWYGDSFNVSKVQWADRNINTAALDLNWPLAGSAYDIASDGQEVWLTALQPGMSEVVRLSTNGVFLGNFTIPSGMENGIAWDGEGLWVGSDEYTGTAVLGHISRYNSTGQPMSAPPALGWSGLNFEINDMAWFQGHLWVLGPYYGYGYGYIACVEPQTGVILGNYKTGEQLSSFGGLASDGANLFAIATPSRIGGLNSPPGAIFPTIVRLGLPDDMLPPKVLGVAASTNSLKITFSERMSLDWAFAKSSYRLESPPGTLIDLSPSSVGFTSADYTNITITGLTLSPNVPLKITVQHASDETGNLIREDGLGNTLTGTVGGLTAPAEVTATVRTNVIDLYWRDASSGETGFWIERRALPSGSWGQIASIPTANSSAVGSAVVYSDNKVSAGVEYSYRIRAYNAVGNSPYSNVATASPGHGFMITDVGLGGDHSVTIRWNGLSGISYKVLRSVTPRFDSFTVVATNIAGVFPATTFSDSATNLIGRSKAFYRVKVE